MFQACFGFGFLITQGERTSAASGSASGATAAQPPTKSQDADMAEFRHASMTPACFAPQRHLFLCVGRPIVVAWLMLNPFVTPIGN